MNWLPHDFVSFIWGLVVAGLAALLSGFFQGIGKDGWQSLKRKLFPKTPDPIEVERDYKSLGYAPGMCEWVRETTLHDRLEAGFTYYIHPDRHARCFRFPDHNRQVREYLMVKPN